MSGYGYGSGMDPAALIGLMLASLAFSAIGYIWLALALGKVFAKLGEESWRAWVPVLNIITLFKLGSVNPLYVLIFLVPFASIVGTVFTFVAVHRINQRFGMGTGMTVLAVVALPVWASILGFGSAVPIGGAKPAARPAKVQSAPLPPMTASSGDGSAQSTPVSSFAPTPTPPAAVAPAAPAAAAAVVPTPPPPGAAAAPVPAPSAEIGLAHDPWAPPAPGTPAATRVLVPELPPLPPVEVVIPPASPVAPAPVPVAAPPAAAEPVVEAAPPAVAEPEAAPQPEAAQAADADELDEKTVVARRPKQPLWIVQAEGGAPILIRKPAALLGRNPATTAQSADAQLVAIPDPSKTVSKTHARIVLTDGQWSIIDLSSTNGVYLLDANGEETELEPGVATPLGASFRLGDLTLRITQES